MGDVVHYGRQDLQRTAPMLGPRALVARRVPAGTLISAVRTSLRKAPGPEEGPDPEVSSENRSQEINRVSHRDGSQPIVPRPGPGQTVDGV
jgi:hypothetical protein